MELTPRQKSVYEVICRYHQRHGFAPTVREICDQLGLAGPAGVHRILGVLEEKGVVCSTPGKKRSWVPVQAEDQGRMPVAGSIAAGKPLDVWERPDERIPVDPAFYGHEGCFALRVCGDSMIGRNICDGDLAVIRPQADVDDGEIAAVIVEGVLTEAALKIVKKKTGVLGLYSANPEYPELWFFGEKRKQVRIIGKYAGLIRKA